MKNKDYTSIQKWNDDYNGAAIYSLVAPDGTRYIGRTFKLQQRLETHRRELNKVYQGREKESNEGEKLINAVKMGVKFKVEILKKVSRKHATMNNMRLLEKHFVQYYGGYKNTYNSEIIDSPNEFHERFYQPYIYPKECD